MQGIARGNPVDLNALASMASQSGSSVPMSQQQMQNVLNARPPPTSSSQVYAQSSANSIALESIRLPSEPPRRPIAFQQIESVVSSRAPGNPFDILNTSQQSGESFEPTDMDLGHSDEDDGHAYVPRERAANQNLRVIETQSTYRPNNHNPHQQSTDYPNQETRNDDWRNRPRSVINRGDGYQPELEAVPLNASRQGGQRGRPRPNQMGHRKGNYSRY
ncbi:hypothetical protein HDE_02889 [Halotydeus destructor]|nr:hypothetical protein HDE_02889 [Halotydeus destructor]